MTAVNQVIRVRCRTRGAEERCESTRLTSRGAVEDRSATHTGRRSMYRRLSKRHNMIMS
jgi:hypothetical protein